MLVLGISGSLRLGCYNGQLLRAAARGLPHEVEFEQWHGLARIPPYREDWDGRSAPQAVEELCETLARADAVLISTPEYNASIPGQLKNALDWASRPLPGNCLERKPVAVIGASTGPFGAIWAQAELRKVLGAIGAHVVDSELPVARAHEAFAPDGSLRDADLRVALAGLTDELLAAAGRTPHPAAAPAAAVAA